MSDRAYLDVECHLTRPERAVLRCHDQQDYTGGIRIDDELRHRLLELEHKRRYKAYGKVLFDAVFAVDGNLQRGLYSAIDSSLKLDARLRFRLNIDSGVPAWLHALHWELLNDGEDFAVGRSPETVFSRYVSLPYAVGPAPARASLLCVIAAPTDAQDYGLATIDCEDTKRSLDRCFAPLRSVLEIEYLERPVTPHRLRDRLQKGGHHLLHIHGHGVLPREREAALVLETTDHRVRFVTETNLRDVLLGLRDLKLVTLVACHGDQPSQQDDHLSGLAGSLVRRNVPAVVAMRRAISMEMGFLFTKLFYREIAEHARVDAAINEARHRLYMKNSTSVDWSSPVLYMRLKDGLPWQLDQSRTKIGTPLIADRPKEGNPPEIGERPSRSRRSRGYLVVLSLVVLAVFIQRFFLPEWQREVPGESDLVIEEPGVDENQGEPSGTIADVPDMKAQEVPGRKQSSLLPSIPLLPIESGTVGIGALGDSPTVSGSEVARAVVLNLRASRPDLAPVIVSEALKSKLARIRSGDLSLLPGGGQSPQGLELFLILTYSVESLPTTGNLHALRFSCEMNLVSAAIVGVLEHRFADSTGMAATRSGAINQAIERCLSKIQDGFPSL